MGYLVPESGYVLLKLDETQLGHLLPMRLILLGKLLVLLLQLLQDNVELLHPPGSRTLIATTASALWRPQHRHSAACRVRKPGEWVVQPHHYLCHNEYCDKAQNQSLPATRHSWRAAYSLRDS